MIGEYQARHPRMRSYQNSVEDLIKCLEECNFNLIPRVQNCVVDSLATSAAAFKVPMHPVGKYEIKVRHGPSVPNNVKIWKVFEDDKKIQKSLTLTKEFDGLIIDEENELLENATLTQGPSQIHIVVPKEIPQEEDVAPLEYVDAGEAEEAWET